MRTVLVIALCVGCAASDDPFDAVEQAATGLPQNTVHPGMVRMKLVDQGEVDWQTGVIVVEPGTEAMRQPGRLVLSSTHWDLGIQICGNKRPKAMAEHGACASCPAANIESRTIVDWIRHPTLPFTLYLLDRGVTVQNVPVLTTSVPSVEEDITCFGYQPTSGELVGVYGSSLGATRPAWQYLFAHDSVSAINDRDESFVCASPDYFTLFGLSVKNDAGGNNLQSSVVDLGDWIAGQAYLAERRELVAPPQRFWGIASPSTGHTVEVPNNSLADGAVLAHRTPQFAARRAQFFDDPGPNPALGKHWLVNMNSGKCVSAGSNGRLVQQPCDFNDPTQEWSYGIQNAASPSRRTVRNPTTNQCWTVPTSTSGDPVSLAPCPAGAPPSSFLFDYLLVLVNFCV